jgi:DNA-3-methyladenine glycosylase II
VEVAMVQAGSARAPKLTVTAQGARLGIRTREALVSTLDKILGLSVDLRPFCHLAKGDQRLAGLIAPFIGFKPPRLPSVFETLVNGIACQQLSLQVGMHLLNRLCRGYGLAVGEHHAFPRPVDLASASPAQLKRLGFSGNKSRVILTAARSVVEGRLNLEGLAALDTAEAIERLVALKGVGRWTAQYILLRGLGRLDVFPADDVGSQNKMQRWLRRKQRPDYERMYRILAPWRPYRGLLYFYLLLDHQARQGLLEPAPTSALKN